MWGIFPMALHSFWPVDLLAGTPHMLTLPKAFMRGSAELDSQNPSATDGGGGGKGAGLTYKR